ncbi:MAG: TetR/AcrR family transcriptional regulator [Fimbriimonas sp.]|nr:TetR/AcrR family transcriptional regulator [Fimbriimonas sp.]
MSRRASPDRRRQIAQAALEAFSASGFRRTQVSEIAKLAGVAPGTLYLYTASKETLFLAALHIALGEQPDQAFEDEQNLLETISVKLTLSKGLPSLFQASRSDGYGVPPLEVIVEEVYDAVDRVAPAIRLVERCAQDWPELAALFYAELRPQLIQILTSYLAKGIEAGLLRPIPDLPLAARLILETIAWFAIHRHGDADGRFFDSVAARATVIDALTHAYASH